MIPGVPAGSTLIDISLNTDALASRIKGMLNDIANPKDLYAVYNTAVNPKGQPYWAAVNYGTSVKVQKVERETIIKGGAPEVRDQKGNLLTRSNTSVRTTSGSLMHFAVGGEVHRFSIVDASPPFHMRERAMPFVTKFFVSLVRRFFNKGGEPLNIVMNPTGSTPGSITTRRTLIDKKTKKYRSEVIATPATLTGGTKFTFERLSRISLANVFTQIMEDTMDLIVSKLAELTPVLQGQYYSEGYTAEPGLLKESYEWTRITGPTAGEFGTAVSASSVHGRRTLPGILLRRVGSHIGGVTATKSMSPAKRKSSFLNAEFKKSYMKASSYPGARNATAKQRAGNKAFIQSLVKTSRSRALNPGMLKISSRTTSFLRKH